MVTKTERGETPPFRRCFFVIIGMNDDKKKIGKIKSDDIRYNQYGFQISSIDETFILPSSFREEIATITGEGDIDYYYGLNWSTKEKISWTDEQKKKLLLQFRKYANHQGGRPVSEDKRNKRVTIYFTQKEIENLKSIMQKTKIKDFNSYLRARIFNNKISIQTEDKNLAELVFQLAKIGNNLNQIAHYFNIKKEENPSTINEHLKIFDEIKFLLFEINKCLKKQNNH